jgi:membrane-bound metal-dependent hydrolase YbcI (DUF457 family)
VPSPVGHALGAIVAGWGVVPRREMTGAAILAAVAVAPDLDLLFPATHRGPSHSIGAVVLAGLLVWSAVAATPLGRTGRRDAARWAAAAALAWGSHILLDWLSNDTRPPLGVMALWPFTHDYYKASIEIFPPVSRRYWESRFWIYNLKAAVVELLIMLPLAALTISRYRSRVRSSGPGDRPPPSGGAGDTDDTSDRPAPREAR